MGDSEKKTKAESFYEDLMTRYERKTVEYQAAWAHYKRMDLMVFTIPLIAIQVANTIIPQFISDTGTTKTIATTLSAISAAWIALRGKLAWDKKHAQYRNATKTYSSLMAEARDTWTMEALAKAEGGFDKEKAMAAREEFVTTAAEHEKQATGQAAPIAATLAANAHVHVAKCTKLVMKTYNDLDEKKKAMRIPKKEK